MKVTKEEAIPIEGHHRDICRFRGPEDPRFEAVWKAIQRLALGEEPDKRMSPCHSFLWFNFSC